jgi:hypothetical protein
MSLARDASFRQIIRDAIGQVGTDFDSGHDFVNKVAKAALDQVHERGLAIHDPANCVRVPWQERGRAEESLGRDMTPEEQVTLGVVKPFDDVPA